MDSKVAITLNQAQILELEEIITDGNQTGALRFLEEHIYKPIKRREEGHCKVQI